jgi:hypothetical protein
MRRTASVLVSDAAKAADCYLPGLTQTWMIVRPAQASTGQRQR